ncbi:hypothetical protein [Methylobacterium brachythecii]|uniref:Porin n=1 Tax=Methylobacterium brachythecii TaxID=1176177 RepID=A0A7W6AK92_9HYPH|nr:hypothetical protein [Methylobacterium brachythecii]MBB3902699.1 hypothetical protein [Methylobacterium brachythecii]GLS42544.1 hypothetical protein GCM10007884_05290 [Methylobacterium brachythecii]
MNKSLKVTVAALVLAGTVSIPMAQAATSKRELARTEAPAKAETCRPKWPYIVLTCVA